MTFSQLSYLIMLLSVVSFSFAQDISIEDFRIPESEYKRLLVGVNGSLNTNTQSSNTTIKNEGNGNDVALNVSNTLGYNSEWKSCLFNFSLIGNYRNNKNDFSGNNSSDYVYTNNVQYLETNIQYQYSSYVTTDEIYLYAQPRGYFSYQLYRNKYDSDNPSSTFSKTRQYNASVGVGIGYGKIRNANSVFAVVRILENLSEDGFLTRELTHEEILVLVEKYEQRVVNNYAHERAAKFILRDLFEELVNKGLLTNEKVLAYATSRTSEVLTESIFPRIFGWMIQTGPQINRNENTYASTSSSGSFDKGISNNWIFSAVYGYPISLNLHWYNDGEISLPVLGKQNRVGYYLSSKLYYEVSNRISSSMGCSFNKSNNYLWLKDNVDYYRFTNQLSSSITVDYFIEDNLSFNTSLSYTDYLDRSEYSNVLFHERRVYDSFNFTFGLNYRIF